MPPGDKASVNWFDKALAEPANIKKANTNAVVIKVKNITTDFLILSILFINKFINFLINDVWVNKRS